MADKILYKLEDFPSDTKNHDWDKEALLFYYYMLNHEEKNEKRVKKIFLDFKRRLLVEKDPLKRKTLYENLKLEIYKIREEFKNDDFTKALAFILLVSPVIRTLEKELESIESKAQHINTLVETVEQKTIKPSLKKAIKESQKEVIEKSARHMELITRNEAWRNVNDSRLQEFLDKGYKYKTTYPVKDQKTGDDSWYYYSLRQIKPINEPFEYVWKGKTRTFMTPPDRPNDRNVLIPYTGDIR